MPRLISNFQTVFFFPCILCSRLGVHGGRLQLWGWLPILLLLAKCSSLELHSALAVLNQQPVHLPPVFLPRLLGCSTLGILCVGEQLAGSKLGSSGFIFFSVQEHLSLHSHPGLTSLSFSLFSFDLLYLSDKPLFFPEFSCSLW